MSKTQKLHFSVCGEGITRLVRDIYLYEEKDKAWNIMGSFEGMSIDQAKAVFLGDAELGNSKEDPDQVIYIVKEDKEWKKELSKHMEFLSSLEKKRIIDEQDKHLARRLQSEYNDETLSDYEALDFIRRAKHMRGTRDILDKAKELVQRTTMAELSEVPEVDNILEELQKKANLDIAKNIFINSFGEKDPEQKKANDELIKNFATKVYSFEYDGHQYTYEDSARNQSECPHCEHKAPDGFFWSSKDEGYLGYHDFNNGQVGVCFECPECFENFYYHYNKNDFLRRLEDDGQ